MTDSATETTSEDVKVETNGEETATVSKPKAKRKPAKKTAKKAKPKEKSNGKAEVVNGAGAGSLKEGGTRIRLFRALKKFPGLTQKQIKAKTGMAENSGHLSVVLAEEIAAKRIRAEESKDSEDRTSLIYVLTAEGKKAFEKKQIKGAGYRIGQEWTKARITAEKKPAKKKKSKK